MREQGFKEVTKKEFVTLSCKCDICGKEVRGELPNEWEEVNYYYPWEASNDDIICSAECYIKALTIAFEDEDIIGVSGIGINMVKNLVDYIKSLKK